MSDSAGAPPSPIDGGWDHSDQPAISSIRGDLFPGSGPQQRSGPNLAGPEPADQVLAAIAARDPGFAEAEFLQQVEGTFFRVEQAWSERRPDISRQVMADGLWQQHRSQIQGYLDGHKRNMLDGLSVLSMAVLVVSSDGRYDTITVRVLASCADYDVDDRNGRVLRGSRDAGEWTEDWTFQRAVGAKTPPAGGTLTSKCPNCGAPIELDSDGVCRYCKALISTGTFDWVLTRISQVPPAY